MSEQHKCNICGAPATIHFTQVIDGKIFSAHLCEKCASMCGAKKFPLMKFAEMLARKVLGKELCKEVFEPENPAKRAKKTCPNCGMTDREFSRAEILGCPKCCETFATELDEILLKIQKTKSHVSATKSSDKKNNEQKTKERKEGDFSEEQLRELIKSSVAKDDYETAAFARDLLRGKTKKAPNTERTERQRHPAKRHLATPKRSPRRTKKKDKNDG